VNVITIEDYRSNPEAQQLVDRIVAAGQIKFAHRFERSSANAWWVRVYKQNAEGSRYLAVRYPDEPVPAFEWLEVVMPDG
jgi:hypothetical protein